MTKMASKYPFLIIFIVVSFQYCLGYTYTRPWTSYYTSYYTPTPEDIQCVNLTERTGILSFSTIATRDFRKCWYINTPEDSYVKLDLLDYRLNDPYCEYMYLQIAEDTGEKYKICQHDWNNYNWKNNWTRTVSGDLTVTLVIRNSWRDSASFQMKFHIENTVCSQKDHFRCSENQCVSSKQVCDGIEDCENGSDENDCAGLLPIQGVSVSRKKAIDWLMRKETDFGWGRNTHRAVTALYLAGELKFDGIRVEEEALVKELELRLATSLLRNSTEPLSANELSMYVNALMVTCHDNRNFYGNDLLKMLAHQTFTSSSPSPGAYLTLCNANWRMSDFNENYLMNLLSSGSEYPFMLEIQAMAVMALSCVQDKKDINASSIYNKTLENFMALQNSDGSFGNAHTTAIVTQALISSGQMNNTLRSVENAMRFLMKNSSSVDFLSVYLTLPLFRGKTLVDVGSVDCSERKRRPGGDEDITDVMDKLRGNVQVQYSLYIGDSKNVIHTMYLKVPDNSTAFDVMKIAQVADPKYKFSYTQIRNQVYVYEVAGITNDMEAGKFWLFHTTPLDSKAQPLKCTKSPNEVIIENNEHLIIWYKTADI